MAAASIAGTVATTSVTAAATAINVNLPGSIAAGETLVILLRLAVPGASDPTGFTGWTVTSDTTDGDRTIVAWKKATGSEGATLALTAASSTKAAGWAFRVSGAADPTVTAPELSSVNTGTSAGPSTLAVTPSGGSNDYLFLALAGKQGEDGATFGFISGSYTAENGGNSVNSGTGGSAASNCGAYVGSKQVTGTTSGSGTFSITSASSDNWTTWTLAIYPTPPANPKPRPPCGLKRQSVQRAACWMKRRSGIFVPRLWVPEGI